MRLILFDIDGTLIDSGGAGVSALNLAFKEHFRFDNAFIGIPMAGRTDMEIMKACIDKYHIPASEETMPRFIDAYLKHLGMAMHNEKKHLKPGILPLLETLREKEDLKLGLLTGNLETGARIKLAAFGLNRFFPTGAFGSDSENRDKLLPLAVKRFNRTFGMDISYDDCIVVGDTPMDVSCSKPYGAVCIAVATGPYPLPVLEETEADLVLNDLSDANAFLDFIYA